MDIWRHNKEKNLGLLIEVEDEKKRKLPVHLFFKKIDCSENFGKRAYYQVVFHTPEIIHRRRFPKNHLFHMYTT